MLPAKHGMLFIQVPTRTIRYEATRKTKGGMNSTTEWTREGRVRQKGLPTLPDPSWKHTLNNCHCLDSTYLYHFSQFPKEVSNTWIIFPPWLVFSLQKMFLFRFLRNETTNSRPTDDRQTTDRWPTVSCRSCSSLLPIHVDSSALKT